MCATIPEFTICGTILRKAKYDWDYATAKIPLAYVNTKHDRSPVNSPHKGQWRGALWFSLICVWIIGWVNNRETGDLRRYRAHYDVTVMLRPNNHNSARYSHWRLIHPWDTLHHLKCNLQQTLNDIFCPKYYFKYHGKCGKIPYSTIYFGHLKIGFRRNRKLIFAYVK